MGCYAELLGDVMDNAATAGIDTPVVFLLDRRSPRGQRIMDDLFGKRPHVVLFANPETGNAFVLLDSADACRLLRDHAGAGGSFVAGKLEGDAGRDFHFVALTEEVIGMAPIQDGQEVWRCTTGFDQACPEYARP